MQLKRQYILRSEDDSYFYEVGDSTETDAECIEIRYFEKPQQGVVQSPPQVLEPRDRIMLDLDEAKLMVKAIQELVQAREGKNT